jgi:transporter family protein
MNWLQLSLLSAFFAGLVAIFGKIGMKDIDSVLATTARAFVMLAVLIILVLSRGKLAQLTKFSWQTWAFIILSGLAGAASWLCYFQALKVGLASRVAPMDRLSTLVTIVLATGFLGEPLSWKVAVGALLIVGGGILVAL